MPRPKLRECPIYQNATHNSGERVGVNGSSGLLIIVRAEVDALTRISNKSQD